MSTSLNLQFHTQALLRLAAAPTRSSAQGVRLPSELFAFLHQNYRPVLENPGLGRSAGQIQIVVVTCKKHSKREISVRMARHIVADISAKMVRTPKTLLGSRLRTKKVAPITT